MRHYTRLQAAQKKTHRSCLPRNKSHKTTGLHGHERYTRIHLLHRTDPQHPLHCLTQERLLNRNIRKIPAHYYSTLYNTLPSAPQNTSLRTLIRHPWHFANRGISKMQPNTIIGKRPFPISEEEITLSREERVHLSRLR